jgi:hypothetical protein
MNRINHILQINRNLKQVFSIPRKGQKYLCVLYRIILKIATGFHVTIYISSLPMIYNNHNPPPNFEWAGLSGFQRCFLVPIKESDSHLGYAGPNFYTITSADSTSCYRWTSFTPSVKIYPRKSTT